MEIYKMLFQTRVLKFQYSISKTLSHFYFNLYSLTLLFFFLFTISYLFLYLINNVFLSKKKLFEFIYVINKRVRRLNYYFFVKRKTSCLRNHNLKVIVIITTTAPLILFYIYFFICLLNRYWKKSERMQFIHVQ